MNNILNLNGFEEMRAKDLLAIDGGRNKIVGIAVAAYEFVSGFVSGFKDGLEGKNTHNR